MIRRTVCITVVPILMNLLTRVDILDTRQPPPIRGTILMHQVPGATREGTFIAMEVRRPTRVHVLERRMREEADKDFRMTFHLPGVLVRHVVIATGYGARGFAVDVAGRRIVDVVDVHRHELIPAVVVVVAVFVVECPDAVEPFRGLVLAPDHRDAFPVVFVPCTDHSVVTRVRLALGFGTVRRRSSGKMEDKWTDLEMITAIGVMTG